MEAKQFYKTSEVAKMCGGVSKSTVLQWIKDDKLAAFRLPGGHYRVSDADLKDFAGLYQIPLPEPMPE